MLLSRVPQTLLVKPSCAVVAGERPIVGSLLGSAGGSEMSWGRCVSRRVIPKRLERSPVECERAGRGHWPSV